MSCVSMTLGRGLGVLLLGRFCTENGSFTQNWSFLAEILTDRVWSISARFVNAANCDFAAIPDIPGKWQLLGKEKSFARQEPDYRLRAQ